MLLFGQGRCERRCRSAWGLEERLLDGMVNGDLLDFGAEAEPWQAGGISSGAAGASGIF